MKNMYVSSVDNSCCENCTNKYNCTHIGKCKIEYKVSCYNGEESDVIVITLISNKDTTLLDITNDIFDKKRELEKNRYVVLLITDLSSPLSSVDKKKISISDEILIFNYTTNISEEAKECINFAKDNNVVVKYKTCLHENLFSDSIKHSSNTTIVKYICKDCSEIITKSYDMATGKEVKNTIDSKEMQSLESKPDKNTVDDFLGIIDYNIIDPSIKKIHINMPTYNNRLYLDFLSNKYNINNIKEIAQNILLDDEDLHENKELIKDVKTMFFIDRFFSYINDISTSNIKENHKGKLLSIEEVLKLKDDTKLYVENSYYDDHFGEDSNIHEMKFFIDKNNQPIISVYMNRNKSYSHYIQENFENLRIYEWVEGDNTNGEK